MKRLVAFAWENLDVLLVMFVAGLVVALDAFDLTSPGIVRSATLALLGVTAFALLRQRSTGYRLEQIAGLITELRSDRPYEVLSEIDRWEISSADSATYCRVQTLRFTKNEVSTLEHWSASSSGGSEKCKAEWRSAASGAWLPAKQIHV